MSDKEVKIQRYDDFLELIKSRDWYLFVEFLQDHQKVLQNKVNGFIRFKEYQDASISLALMDECDTLIEVFKRRGNELKGKAEEKDG